MNVYDCTEIPFDRFPESIKAVFKQKGILLGLSLFLQIGFASSS